MDEIRWGIIGCGDVTEVKSGPAFQKANNSRLVAVMRRNANLAEDYAERHKIPKWYSSVQDLINDPEIDAVYIATPPSTHKEYTLLVAKAKKAVYVEKPMAINYSQCKEMIKGCEDSGVPLFVAYYRRALPRFIKIKELIRIGYIGKIRAVNILFLKEQSMKDLNKEQNWRVNPSISGGGYFYDLASHQIDLLQYFFGDINIVKGIHENQANLYEAEDAVSAVFSFSNKILASGVWNFNAYKELDRIDIIGEKGSISFPTFDPAPIVVENEKGIENIFIENPLNIQLPLIQKIVDELLGGEKSPSDGYSGSLTNKIIDQVFEK